MPRVERPAPDCLVFLPENHPAYISWEQYQHNIYCLRQQRRRGPVPGPAQQQAAVLAGLVVCGQCGSHMHTHYTKSLRYICQRRYLDEAGPLCQSFAATALEHVAAEQILQVVTPAGLELSRQAAAACERERAALDQHWRLRLEHARQDAARAFQQYNAVEPDHRLVARTLERRWEEALRTQKSLEKEYHRFQQAQPVRLTATERAQLDTLAQNLPALWHAPHTSIADKRQVARLLLQRVVVWAPADRHAMRVHWHWTGGVVTEQRLRRPLAAWRQLADRAAILECLRVWQAEGWSSRRMAEALNAAGHRTPRDLPFTADSVRQLLRRHPSGRGNRQRQKPPRPA